LSAHFPNHETVLFERASHFLQQDEGYQLAEALRGFVIVTLGIPGASRPERQWT